MGDFQAPPSMSVPIALDAKKDKVTLTDVWYRWFVDLQRIVNASGGVSGGVPSSRQILTPSPLTGGGDLTADRTITFSNETANKVFAGPTSGVPAVPAFRSLVTGDLPDLAYVDSVGLADGSGTPIYLISGSPVTDTGTLTFTLATQAANLVFVGPTSGASAQPGFRALVAADIPAPSWTRTFAMMGA